MLSREDTLQTKIPIDRCRPLIDCHRNPLVALTSKLKLNKILG